ncbi:MAG: T9SS type A sorting domain-containing protein, partial [Bacteroidota bacterium]
EEDFFVNIPSGQGLSLQQSLNDDDELEWFEELSTFCTPNLNRPTTTSTFDPSELAQVNIFPNPANSFLQLEAVEFGTGQISIQLIDLNGIVILEQDNDFGQNNTRIDLSTVPSGQYMLSVRSASAFRATRVLIQR